jgi:hypothetical protein
VRIWVFVERSLKRRRGLAGVNAGPGGGGGQTPHAWGRDRSPEPQFIESLATKLANDPSVHCGMRAEQDVVIPLFLKDDKLSGAEWKAVTGMLRRTPGDAKVRRCDHAAAASVQGDVPFAERLKTLADFDCAPTRHERLRGDLVRSVIGLQMDEQAKRTADQVKAAFVGCLEK